jgi:hypothetical protein
MRARSLGSVPWSDLLATTGALLLVSIPLGISVIALLDAARRPQWAWSLAERNQLMWLAMILVGILSVLLGLAISGWYLLRVRPVVAAAEAGRVPERRARTADRGAPPHN